MKKTIAELRHEQVYKLATFKNPEPTDDDIRIATTHMNSFYRLCGLAEKNLHLTNDEKTANKASTAYSEKREQDWFERLNKTFREHYGLCLTYCGYMPSIGVKNEQGAFTEKIERYFYE